MALAAFVLAGLVVTLTPDRSAPEQIAADELITQKKIEVFATVTAKMKQLANSPDRSLVVGQKDGKEISLLCFLCGEGDIRHVMLCENPENCQDLHYALRATGLVPGVWEWLADAIIHEPGSLGYAMAATKFVQQ